MADTSLKLTCAECQRITYRRPASTRKKGIERVKLETKKYCKFCRKHTVHKEAR